ncbi:hypothetical protein FKM82_025044 [Ascaphus truei]
MMDHRAIMAFKILFLLVTVLTLGHQSLAKKSSSSSSSEEHIANAKQCNVAPYQRRNCGYKGISASECQKRKCCFDSSISEVIWCFYTKSQDKHCSVSSKKRTNCGYPNISAKDCYNQGCCFDSSVPNTPWCFYSSK